MLSDRDREVATIAASHRSAGLFALAVVAASLIAAVGANAAGTKHVQRKIDRTKERRVYTSRSMTADRDILQSQQPDLSDFEPRSSGYDILIDKSSRQMTIFVSGKLYSTYRVCLGFTPDGRKTRRGDGCTPEGKYYICKRNERSEFYRSLLISYPSPEDAKRGVEAGLVGRSTLNAVIRAHRRGIKPPQNTRLGGNICIHGEGSYSRPPNDWTAGCIAVRNEEIDEIFSLIPVGTPVTIRP